jgi:hypothetical protein
MVSVSEWPLTPFILLGVRVRTWGRGPKEMSSLGDGGMVWVDVNFQEPLSNKMALGARSVIWI